MLKGDLRIAEALDVNKKTEKRAGRVVVLLQTSGDFWYFSMLDLTIWGPFQLDSGLIFFAE